MGTSLWPSVKEGRSWVILQCSPWTPNLASRSITAEQVRTWIPEPDHLGTANQSLYFSCWDTIMCLDLENNHLESLELFVTGQLQKHRWVVLLGACLLSSLWWEMSLRLLDCPLFFCVCGGGLAHLCSGLSLLVLRDWTWARFYLGL